MNGADSGVAQLLSTVGLLVLGGVITAALKFLADRIGVQMGWNREDKRDQDGKIQRIDSHARAEIARIEKELGGRVAAVETDVGILTERVANLPTADDIQSLDRRLADVDRGLSGVVSKVDGMSGNVKTILEHILSQERRG